MSDTPSESAQQSADYYRSESVEERDPLAHFEQEFHESFARMPPVNILVTGKTGVGKSTVINTVFRKPVAKTGMGKPVTDRVEKYSSPDLPVTLYDTPGIELGQEAEAVARDFAELITSKLNGKPEEHIHVLWYCIHAEHRRIEDYEEDLIRALASHIPVVLVMTQVLGPQDKSALAFAAELEKLKLPIAEAVPVKTLCEPREVGPYTVEPFGLNDLVELTYRVLPEGVKRAFINAQGVVIELKVSEARKTVLPWATGVAAAIGAVPIPVPDAGPLLALQLGMMARITAVMGVDLDEAARSSLIKGFVSSGGAAFIGKAAASFLLKFVPVAGSVINASVAGSLTLALGEAYIRLCAEILKREAAGKPMPDTEMLDFLIAEFKRNYKRKS